MSFDEEHLDEHYLCQREVAELKLERDALREQVKRLRDTCATVRGVLQSNIIKYDDVRYALDMLDAALAATAPPSTDSMGSGGEKGAGRKAVSKLEKRIMGGLTATIGHEGLWLNFESGGKKASLNIGNMVQNSGPIIRGAVHGWIQNACRELQATDAAEPTAPPGEGT